MKTWRGIGWLSPIGIVLSLALVGCSTDTDSPTGQENPQSIVHKFLECAIRGDKERFVECFAGPEKCKDHARAYYDVIQNTTVLYDALENRYGKESWSRFVGLIRQACQQDTARQGQEGELFFNPVFWKDTNYAEKLWFERRGDNVWVMDKELGQTGWVLVEKKGIWRIDWLKIYTVKGLAECTKGYAAVSTGSLEAVQRLREDKGIELADVARTYAKRVLSLQQ